jgi:hypothetical protein
MQSNTNPAGPDEDPALEMTRTPAWPPSVPPTQRHGRFLEAVRRREVGDAELLEEPVARVLIGCRRRDPNERASDHQRRTRLFFMGLFA